MFDHFDTYLELRKGGSYSLSELGELVRIEHGGDPLFDRLIDLGIDPGEIGVVSIPIVKAVIRKEEIAREKIRINNRLVALSKDREIVKPAEKVGRRKVSERVKCRAKHVEMFPCAQHPYNLARIEKARIIGEKLAQANAAKNGGNQTYKD